MDVTLKRCALDSVLVNPKCGGLEVAGFYFFQNVSVVCLQFFKKTNASLTHLGFTDVWSNMHRFIATGISF